MKAAGIQIRQSNEPEANNANYKTIIREMKMKTSKYIFLSLAAAFVATACNQEMNPDNPNKANPGDEVQFGLSLPGKTKTIYGEEDTKTKTFPIYWVDGDLVKVASPQCQSGRNNAEYSVSVESETQNYATALTRTGEYGVQWGSEGTADFYSIYPSTAGTTLNIDGETVTATLHVDATQFANTTNYETSVYAQPAEMGNVVMYAKATASKTDPAVELHYTPFSTVIEFELTAPDKSDSQHQSEIIIQSITLVAPQGITIAGDFTFNFPNTENDNPSATAYGVGNNTITLHFLDNNQYTAKLSTLVRTLKAKMCVMPISGVENLSSEWKVEVATSAGTFSKTLTDQTGELKPGLVHKIKLPQLNYGASEWVFKPDNWIQSLPDYENIYLSELSLPGAWYAGTPLESDTKENYQSTESIEDLWTAGIRAFAVETKTVTPERKESGWIFTTYSCYENPVGIAISGTQGNGSRLDSGNKSKGTNSLNPNGTGSDYVSYIKSDTKKIETLITEIAKQVTEDEYAVLVLSYADGGSSGLRYVDFGAWLYLLNNAYNNLSSDVKGKICNQEITPNTTIKDVLGKLILKINVDKNIAMWGKVGSYSYTYGNNLPALFSYNPFLNTTQMSDSDFATPCYSDLYWSSWSDSETTHRKYSQLAPGMDAAGKFMWVFSSANRTDCTGRTNYNGVVTLSQRQTALSAMMNYSKKIYEASTHNVWFYFNCGGTSTTQTSGTGDAAAFATNMNGWLLSQINAKTDPSPLGIVMFNRCTDSNYEGPEIIKAIIEMNSRFYLKHAGTSGGSTGGSTGGSGSETAQNDVLVTNGGDAI